MATDYGPWAPADRASLSRLLQRFGAASFRWWVSGGLALELWTGRSWRAHGDVDIGIVRADFPRVAAALDGYALFVAASGKLSPYEGQALASRRHENNVWARDPVTELWQLDVQLGEGDATHWIYRRDSSVRRPWPTAVLADRNGVPYLAPDLQLLFKSKQPRAKDHEDAAQVIPALAVEQRAFLRAQLATDHPWQRLLA